MFEEHPEGGVSRAMLAPHVAGISIDRPSKRNGFTPRMLTEMARAYTEADADPEVRVLLLHARGGHFTGGLDLPAIAAAGGTARALFGADGVDPLGLAGRPRTKPVVVAVEGVCYTIGIELILAADIAVGAEDSRYAQLEVQRGIMAYGGATLRMSQRFGWGNAMRYLLTGDVFDAPTAHAIGLLQDLAPPGGALEAALAIAERIAAASPLAVQATLANAMLRARAGEAAAIEALFPEVARLSRTEDAAEGIAAFRERRAPHFPGR